MTDYATNRVLATVVVTSGLPSFKLTDGFYFNHWVPNVPVMELAKLASAFLRLHSSHLSATACRRFCPVVHDQTRSYAARKGTREKARKKKVKIEVKEVGFIPHKLREKGTKGPFVSRRVSDDHKPLPLDNVWIARFYKGKVYDFQEAVACHRETHHPEIYNVPNAPLQTFIELDMSTNKKTKFVDKFSKVAKTPYPFDHGEDRSILAFCKTPEIKLEAETAGATLVGDVDIIKKIERGEIVLPDFHFILAHPNILPELISIRGLLKKKFPSPKNGTLGHDLAGMVNNFLKGMQYWALRDESELDYGWVETTIGTLDMKTEHLEANFKSLLESINEMKPKKDGAFITRAYLKSPPSKEKLCVSLEPYLAKESSEQTDDSDSDDEVSQKVAKAA